MVDALRSSRTKLSAAVLTGLLQKPWLMMGLIRRALTLVGRKSVEKYVVSEGAKVSFLAVHPERRTMQSGPKLMKCVIDELRQAGAGVIMAEVDKSNPRVIRLHSRLGAAVVKELVTPAGVPRVIMAYPALTSQSAA